MENYENINKADPALSRYQNYRIKHKRPVNWLLILLIQLTLAAALTLIVLMFRYISVFEPAFNAIKNFIKKDLFENLILYSKSIV